MEFILGILFLLVIDIVLSVDNAILIASTTKDLEGSQKKWAQILGATGAVLLRLIFVFILMFAFTILEGVILIYILGGAVLIYIGISITNKSDDNHQGKSSSSLFKAVALIMAGDVMMSFDNALIISEVAIDISNDSIWMMISIVTIALILSLAIIIFFSSQLAKFMKKNEWLIYVAAWLLLGVGIEMIFKDPLFNIHINHIWIMLISYSLAGIVIGMKYYFYDRCWNEECPVDWTKDSEEDVKEETENKKDAN